MKYADMKGSDPARQFPALYAILQSWGVLNTRNEGDNDGLKHHLTIMRPNHKGVSLYAASNSPISLEIAVMDINQRQAEIKAILRDIGRSESLTKELAEKYSVSVRTIRRDIESIVDEALAFYLESEADGQPV
jgi:hypothetical protein